MQTLVSTRRRSITVAFVASSLLLVASPRTANAQIVFNNGTPNNATAGSSDPNVPQFLADTFSFASTTTFDSVVWFGSYGPSNTPTAPDAFTISLFNTTGGVPNTTPFVSYNILNTATRTPTGGTRLGLTIYQYSSVLPVSQTLGAGTYGISIVNDTTADTNDNWAWEASSTTGNFYFRPTPTGNFAATNGELAFRLVNTAAGASAPEPATLFLVALGVLSSSATVLRRRKANGS